MKKILLFIACSIVLYAPLSAQFFQGLRASPFGGITNVNYNPAIADNRFLVDINLIGVGMNLNNNYIGIDRNVFLHPGSIQGDSFQDRYLKERLNGNDKSVYIGTQIQGPLSFMFSFGKKKNLNAIGFSYHANFVFNADDMDETFSRIAYLGAGTRAEDALNYLDKQLIDVNPSAKAMAWIDYGITYSRVVLDAPKHMIKVGGTFKLLQGIDAGYIYVDNLKYKWGNFDTLDILQTDVEYKYSEGMLTSKDYDIDAVTDQFADFFQFKNSKPNFGLDLGIIYEWRPDKDKYKYQMDCEDRWRFDQNRYKLAAGFSLIDFGAIRFTTGEYSRNFHANITDWDVGNAKFPDGLQSIDDTIRTRFTVKNDSAKTFRMWLPTRFNIFFDYNIAYGFGLNAMANISVNMAPSRNMVHHVTNFSITPKYDHKWFGLYLPFTYDVLGNYSWGATMRLGPLTIGTQDILGLFAKSHVYNADIHMGLKITIPYRKIKDHDKDGVSNRKDKCKREVGTCASEGCADRDGDGITDSKDRCPDTPGLPEYQGCPDTDKDGIIDLVDSCVFEPGLAEFHGCPDRDSDKVMDKMDECPDTPGKVEFNGCPDRDNDGVPDKIDLCPDVPGDKAHFGCPDTDGDGIYDNEDRCIQVKGPKENNGCPWPDKDGDGVFDKDDACPTVPGVVENKGCPQLEKKEIETVKFAFDNLEFETGKDIIRKHSYPSLNALADLLIKKPNYGLRIEGHTDNVGTDENNLILSQKRATAVKTYLTKRGVNAANLDAFGYGESMPIADNTTTEGKQRNRRVEMKITFK